MLGRRVVRRDMSLLLNCRANTVMEGDEVGVLRYRGVRGGGDEEPRLLCPEKNINKGRHWRRW